MWAKQSTAATLIVGPILDSAGAEYTGAVIGDLSISKNGGTLTAMAAAATLTHIANGQYTLVTTTANLDTLGRAQITCNKSTYQMPEVRLMVVPAMVFDSMILGSDFLQSDAVQFAGQTITAAAGVTLPSSVASPTNITAATGIVLSGVTHTNAVIPTVSVLTGHTPQTGDSFARIGATGSGLTSLAPSSTALSTAVWTNGLATNLGTTNTTVASNLDAAISTRSTYAGGDTAGTTTLLSRIGSTITITGGAVTAVLDTAVETQIDNIENGVAYSLAVLAGACADPQTASETYAITVFGSTFTVDMAGQTSTGTRTAPTLTKT